MKKVITLIVANFICIYTIAQSYRILDNNPQWTYVDGEIVVKTIFDENDYPVREDTTVYVSFYRLYIDGTDERDGNTYERLCEDYIDGNLEDGDQSYKGKYILGVHQSEAGSTIYANQGMFEKCTGVDLDFLSPYPLLDCHDIELYSFGFLDEGKKYEYETQNSSNFADREIPWFQITGKGTETIGSKSFDYTDVNCYNVEQYRVYNKLGALNRWWYNPLLVSFAYSPSYIDRHFMYLNTYSENGKVVYTAPEYTGDPEKKHLSKDTYREDPFLPKDTPTDMSFAIKNATFDTEYDYSGWEGDSFRGYRPVSTCGGFTGDDTWQDLENLPEGMYRVGVRGLYCYGYHIGDWMRKDDPSVRYAKLYGQSGENRLYHELPTISSAASESKVEGLGTYNDNGMYVPYNMEEFTAFKNAGLVKETSVLVPVGKDGKLRIGMSRDYMKVSIDLCFVDDFSLTYYGNSDDAFYMWRDEVIGTSLNKEKIAEHKVVYNKTYMEKYDKAINDAKNAGNKDDITVCVPKVKIAADSLVENISAYYWYGQLVEDIREYFNKYSDMTDENTAGLKSYVFTYFEPNGTFPNGSALYILDKAGLTTEEIRAEHTVINRTFRGPVHTSIEKVEDNSDGVRTDNAIYDLMGRRLNGVPAKGIYIQNGKKYVR